MAIANQRLVRVMYREKRRVLEPHMVGEYSDHRRVLVAWQRLNEADPSRAASWQHYLLSEIRTVEELADPFDAPRLGFSPARETRIQRIHCCVPTLGLARD
jgi:hypothetical protein